MVWSPGQLSWVFLPSTSSTSLENNAEFVWPDFRGHDLPSPLLVHLFHLCQVYKNVSSADLKIRINRLNSFLTALLKTVALCQQWI